LERYVFRDDLPNGKRPWRLASEVTGPEDSRIVVTSLEDHIQKFMIKVWQYITTEPLWQDPVVQRQVSIVLG
jgi:hypothetical protein